MTQRWDVLSDAFCSVPGQTVGESYALNLFRGLSQDNRNGGLNDHNIFRKKKFLLAQIRHLCVASETSQEDCRQQAVKLLVTCVLISQGGKMQPALIQPVLRSCPNDGSFFLSGLDQSQVISFGYCLSFTMFSPVPTTHMQEEHPASTCKAPSSLGSAQNLGSGQAAEVLAVLVLPRLPCFRVQKNKCIPYHAFASGSSV
ncbi:hypothetical protein Y1Q_0004932 [Alligator mississippiensis]|uniref:Uncharacterized protein n=1 Tax=Alligator mississippiensis TaxID=8496 RepID=A0A151MYE5_ALLMI|nr:hypothetical protein Y1Q_0004932 [Alligator mississippiensis]